MLALTNSSEPQSLRNASYSIPCTSCTCLYNIQHQPVQACASHWVTLMGLQDLWDTDCSEQSTMPTSPHYERIPPGATALTALALMSPQICCDSLVLDRAAIANHNPHFSKRMVQMVDNIGCVPALRLGALLGACSQTCSWAIQAAFSASHAGRPGITRRPSHVSRCP